MTSDELQKGIEAIYGLEVVGERFDLALTLQLLELLGNPHTKYRTIQITGTNGKGSTARYLQALLQSETTKVGLYTSPHIFKYNERFDINGKSIPDKKLGRLIGEMNAVCDANAIHPTFFEFTTALGFLYFANQEVDIAIIEMGVGSPLDSTNCITPAVSIITNIGLDHMALLGNTELAIAKSKACVIKEGTEFVTAVKQPELAQYFESLCEELEVPYTHTSSYDDAFMPIRSQDGVIRKIRWTGKDIKFQSVAPYQLENMQTALVAAEKNGWPYEPLNLEKVHVVGRHDVFYEECPILVDGAHNELGFTALSQSIAQNNQLDFSKAVLVVALSDATKIDALKDFVQPFAHVIVTKGTHKAYDPNLILEKLDYTYGQVVEDPLAALALAKTFEPTCIVVTGSLYMIPQILEQFL